MPTGYTAKLHDGPQSFREFVLSCARNFGALCSMREDGMDVPVPEKLEPSDYHFKALGKAQADLADVSGMSSLDCEKEAQREHTSALDYFNKSAVERKERVHRYSLMTNRVMGWIPPTAEHVELRKFMLQQLEGSSRFDYSYSPEVPKLKTGGEWKAEKIESLSRDIGYHSEHYAKDVARAESNTLWVKALRDSLQ